MDHDRIITADGPVCDCCEVYPCGDNRGTKEER
jgi:hypothetical protein